MLILFCFFLIQQYKINKSLAQYLFSLTIIIIFLCIIGYVGTELFPIYIIIISQFYRFTVLIYWMSAVLIFGTVFNMVLINKSNKILLLIPIFLPFIRNIQFNKVFLISIIILVLLIIFSRKLSQFLFILILIFGFSLQHYHDRLNINSITGHPTTETTLALWVKNNTPNDSIILIPPDFEKFRVVSERAIVVDRKSFPFQKNAILEWAKRICDISNQPECNYRNMNLSIAVNGYDNLTLTDLERLQIEYSFDYFIGRNELPLIAEYSDSGFFIYKWSIQSGFIKKLD